MRKYAKTIKEMSLAQFLLLGRLSTQSLSFVSNKVLKFLAIGPIGSGELPKELSENALHLTQQACVVQVGSLEAFEWKALEQQENQGLVCGEDMLLPSNLSLLGFIWEKFLAVKCVKSKNFRCKKIECRQSVLFLISY